MDYQKDHEKIQEYAKALRQCQYSTTRRDCVGCPYYDDDACDSVTMAGAADVIEALLWELTEYPNRGAGRAGGGDVGTVCGTVPTMEAET